MFYDPTVSSSGWLGLRLSDPTFPLAGKPIWLCNILFPCTSEKVPKDLCPALVSLSAKDVICRDRSYLIALPSFYFNEEIGHLCEI